jgi:hypothetical protein
MTTSRTAAEKRSAVEARARERGVKPIDDYEQFLEEVGGVWPEDEELDEFLGWLRQARREGRY